MPLGIPGGLHNYLLPQNNYLKDGSHSTQISPIRFLVLAGTWAGNNCIVFSHDGVAPSWVLYWTTHSDRTVISSVTSELPIKYRMLVKYYSLTCDYR